MRNAIARMVKVSGVALLALALVALISACGGSSGAGDDAATNGGSGDVEEHVEDADEHTDDGDGDEGGESVHVTLAEWTITPAHGEDFELDAGEMVFEIHNDGAAPHDLMVIRTDLAPDALPIVDGIVDQEAAGEVIGGVDPIAGGEIYVEEYSLDAGSYVMVCTIPGHYQQGMSAELTVH